MTRILAFGDTHVGAGPDYGREPFGPRSRLADHAAGLDAVVELALEQRAQLVIHTGDVWHRRRPTPHEIDVVRARLVEPLREAGIPLIVIAGNHDVEAVDRVAAPELLRGDGVRVYRKPAVGFLRPGADSAEVAVLPWVPVAGLVAEQAGGDRDALNEEAARMLIEIARGLRAQAGEDAILVTHFSIGGSTLPNGLPVAELREPVLPLHELTALDFKAVVAGHIHKPQILDWSGGERTHPVFYTGSPWVVDFGEAETPHGAWTFDTDDPLGTLHAHELEGRRFVTYDAELVDFGDGIGVGLTAPAEHVPSMRDAVVRVIYRGSRELARRLNVGQLRRDVYAGGCWKIYSIKAELDRADQARVEGLDETIGPREALEAWIGTQSDWSDARRDAVRNLGAHYIERMAA